MKVTRSLPENFQNEHLSYFEYHLEIVLPNIGFKQIPGYYLLFTNGVLVHGLKVEKQSLLYDTRLEESGGNFFFPKFLIKLLLGKRRIERLKGYNSFTTIVNEWSHNYFHWFTEALPKLMIAIEAGFKPVVLLPSTHKETFHFRSLKMLNIDYKIFSGDVLIGKGIMLPYRLAPFSGHFNPGVLMRMVLLLKNSVEKNINKGRKIFLSRRRALKRKIQNEAQVVKVLEEFGFCVLEAENLSLDEQISIMHHTDVLVSVHGAGLTNMIFCNPGTKILELSLQNQGLDKCYFNLANAMDLAYFYQFCESANSKEEYYSANLVVDLAVFRKNLVKIMRGNV